MRARGANVRGGGVLPGKTSLELSHSVPPSHKSLIGAIGSNVAQAICPKEPTNKLKKIVIAYIEGKIDELTAEVAVIEAQGVGFDLAISLQTYEALRGRERARLYVYEQVRQDQATQLFGFSTKAERELFLLLLSVSGIGGQTARSIVSAYSPDELTRIIANEDKRALTAIKGIGKKAAERIVVELRDKVQLPVGAGYASPPGSATTLAQAAAQEAVSALTTLGFPSPMVAKAVAAITAAAPGLGVEEIIKQALKQMSAK